MTIETNYRDNEALRNSFNELAGKIFSGLNFENWYRNGFWKDNYIPYSVVVDGKVVSNISVNTCDMNYDGRIVKLIQLGTVMTDPDYRGRGYARLLMEKVFEEYEGKVDGIYLYGNDSVVDFYPKFGFRKSKEYRYSKAVEIDNDRTAKLVPMAEKSDFDKMVRILDSTEQNAKLYMVNNPGLYMFYLSQFMQENTFYIDGTDSYAIAEIDADTLNLHAIIGNAPLDDVIASFGKDIKNAVLCFTPHDVTGYDKSEVFEEDTTFFVRGKFFDETSENAFMFQEITHA
ncbi:GNAT family N-acetyltransferase [Butyrivibrio sp. XB500-5]|uniref:GNAT family N-acetyltransferase n=1 Tax=Butyrivibrio sp. XB500-5 TaxID=2364880 RepID=UPI000EAA79BC|nr:GNAT family N-acetyltransferase [Butyrivibrio sp. XB500-5]RKM63066.1 GNAT family N-acetyltransferase [Butyrivibrio sp. XB500-5]